VLQLHSYTSKLLSNPYFEQSPNSPAFCETSMFISVLQQHARMPLPEQNKSNPETHIGGAAAGA